MSDRVALGAEAQALLNNPAFIAATSHYREHLSGLWASKNSTTEQREDLWRKLQALDGVEAALATLVGGGRLESASAEASKPRAQTANKRK